MIQVWDAETLVQQPCERRMRARATWCLCLYACAVAFPILFTAPAIIWPESRRRPGRGRQEGAYLPPLLGTG